MFIVYMFSFTEQNKIHIERILMSILNTQVLVSIPNNLIAKITVGLKVSKCEQERNRHYSGTKHCR